MQKDTILSLLSFTHSALYTCDCLCTLSILHFVGEHSIVAALEIFYEKYIYRGHTSCIVPQEPVYH